MSQARGHREQRNLPRALKEKQGHQCDRAKWSPEAGQQEMRSEKQAGSDQGAEAWRGW